MKNKKGFIKGVLAFLFLGILACLAFFPESGFRMYIAPAGIALILSVIHIYMPLLADIPEDNPKVKTMRRYNMLTAAIIFGIFIARYFLPESALAEKDRFLLPFSVAITILIGNAAPKLPINCVMGIRLPWTRRDPDTWRVAHQILGYCTFPIAFIMIVVSTLPLPVIFSVGGLLMFALIPSVYSFIYYYRKR